MYSKKELETILPYQAKAMCFIQTELEKMEMDEHIQELKDHMDNKYPDSFMSKMEQETKEDLDALHL